jgi:hypothetical protein
MTNTITTITITTPTPKVTKGTNDTFIISGASGSTINISSSSNNFPSGSSYTLVDQNGNTITNQINIPAGQTSDTLTVQTTPDYTVSNPNETVTVNLLPSSSTSSSYTLPIFSGSTATPISVSGNPSGVAVGTLTSGTPIIVTADSGSNQVSLLLGDGTGNFTTSSSPSIGTQSTSTDPTAIAFGAFNGETNNQDIVVANYNNSSNTGGSISLLLSNGKGNFSTATEYTLPINPVALAVGDITGSGKQQDVVTANPLDGSISVLLGNGAGGFYTTGANQPTYYSVSFTSQLSPVSVVVGDFVTGNTLGDVATANSTCNNVSILLNTGASNSGYFSATTPSIVTINGTNPDPVSIAEGYFAGKTSPLELVTANEGNGTVSVLTNNGAGTFTDSSSNDISVGGGDPLQVVTGDFTGNGNIDIATLNNNNTISVLLGDGKGDFGTATEYSLGVTLGASTSSSPISLAAGSIVTGGEQSLVLTDPANNKVYTFLNNNSGQLILLNQAPSLTVPGTQNASVNTSKSITGISIKADGTETITAVLTAADGTLSLGSSTKDISSGANNSSSITLTGTLSNLNSDLQNLAYTGNPGFQGSGQINLKVSEPGTSLDGGTLSTTGNIAVNIGNLYVGSNNTIDNGNNFGSLLFSQLSESSNTTSEIGVFAVNDDNGDITYNGTNYAPGQAGYTKAALSESQILYGLDPTSVPGSYAQSQLLNPGSDLGFYVVTNGTANQELADLASGQTSNQPNVFFNFSAANSDKLNHVLVSSNQTTNQLQLQWNTTLGSSNAFTGSLSINTGSSTNLQQGTIKPIIDTTNGASLQVKVQVTSDALFSDFVGFYPIANANGTLENGLKPGQAGYAAAAVSEIIPSLEFDQQIGTVTHNSAVYNPADLPWQSTLTVTFAAGSLYAPVLISNGNPQSFESENPNNTAPSDLSTNTVGALPIAYFAFVDTTNSDGIDHIRALPGNTLGFKDYYGGGDLDYNDIVLHLTPTNTSQLITSQAPTY